MWNLAFSPTGSCHRAVSWFCVISHRNKRVFLSCQTSSLSFTHGNSVLIGFLWDKDLCNLVDALFSCLQGMGVTHVTQPFSLSYDLNWVGATRMCFKQGSMCTLQWGYWGAATGIETSWINLLESNTDRSLIMGCPFNQRSLLVPSPP